MEAVLEVLVTSKGQKVETTLTDDEAADILSEKRSKNDFAMSLVQQMPYLSPKQRPWLHLLAMEAVRGPREDVAVLDLGSIRVLLQRARDNGTKWPKLVTDRFRFSLAGPNAMYPGAVNILSVYKTERGDRDWYGRIHTDGKLQSGAALSEDLIGVLKTIADDPEEYMIEHGRQLGSCCFCGRELSTNESLAVGYGPICAGKFGLPWGEKEKTDA